jgi:hypothetical protein
MEVVQLVGMAYLFLVGYLLGLILIILRRELYLELMKLVQFIIDMSVKFINLHINLDLKYV